MFIRVLGRVGFGAEPTSVTLITERVTAMVLAHLASAGGRAVAPDTLTESVWDRPTRSSRNAVQVAVTKLRRSLGPQSVATDRAGYALRTDLVRVDWLEALDAERHGRDLVHQGAHQRALLVVDRALALFDDVPFAGLESVATTRLRERAEQTLGAITILRARCLVASGRAEEAIEPLRSRLARDRFDEPVATLLIEALARAGRTADAVTVFHDVRGRLGEDLGVGPSEATVGMFHRVLTDSLPPITVAAEFVGAVPEPAAPTFGRDADVAQISALIAQGHRLVTIVGAGGLGKSTVAVLAARGVAGHRGRPSVMVDLTLCARPEDVATVATNVLDPADVGLDAALVGAAPVVVLDNAEHVIAATADFARRLLAIAGVDVLVTSRRPLHLKDELLFHLEPLIGVGHANAALDMLLDRAGLTVDQVGTELGQLQHVAARADGVPLVLELFAAALRWRAPTALLADLDVQATVVAGHDATDRPTRQRTVAGVVDWSLGQLHPEITAALAALTVIRGNFDEQAAAAVIAPTTDLPVTEVLGGALDVSLLQRVRQPGRVRFRMLEPVRQGIRASTTGQLTDAVHHAHARYFLGHVQAADDLSATQANAYSGLADWDQGNVQPALSWLWEHDPAAALERLPAVINYWAPNIIDDETYFRWIDVALESENHGDVNRAYVAIARLGAIVFFRNERPGEVATLRGVIAPFTGKLERRWNFRLKSAEGGWARAHGDLPAAIALLEASDPTGARDRVLTDARIGECHWYAGDHDRALAALDAADLELRRLQDYGLQRAVLSTRMLLALQHADIAAARTHLTDLDRLVKTAGEPADQTYVLSHVAWFDIDTGRFTEALDCVRELLTARDFLRVPVHLLDVAMMTAFALIGLGAAGPGSTAAALSWKLNSDHPGILNPYARRQLQRLPLTTGGDAHRGWTDEQAAVELVQTLIAGGGDHRSPIRTADKSGLSKG